MLSLRRSSAKKMRSKTNNLTKHEISLKVILSLCISGQAVGQCQPVKVCAKERTAVQSDSNQRRIS